MKTERSKPDLARLESLARRARRRRLDSFIVSREPNLRALTGIDCDSATLLVDCRGKLESKTTLFTDFRYVPMVHRLAPWLKVSSAKRGEIKLPGRRAGCEMSMAHSRFAELQKSHRAVSFVDIEGDILELRSVKTPDEIAAVRNAARLNDEIWQEAASSFVPGMSERDMARLIKHLMIERGDGEAFETIVSIGANAAECHHVPGETPWDGREPVLVDMGVKVGGYCSDMTRNLLPRRMSASYRKVYELVLAANRATVAAVRPGIAAGELDAIARRMIRRGGYGKCFGHSLGHGVGLEIHERPFARRGDKTVLRPGMIVTVEPGIYLEGNLGVRIEDLVLVTESGGECLSTSPR